MFNKTLNIWGIYAPTNAKNRKIWLRELGREIRQTNNGYRTIAGDFNFIMNINLDKRGGRSYRGNAGIKEQKEWEKEFEITDVWRNKTLMI